MALFTFKKPKIFWINVDVAFKEPLLAEYLHSQLEIFGGEGEPSGDYLLGYIKTFGITNLDQEKAKSRIIKEIKQQPFMIGIGFDVDFFEVGVIQEEEIEEEIYNDEDIEGAIHQDPRKIGFYYKSGRAFYSDDDENC